MAAAVFFSLTVVMLVVLLTRRAVPVTREGFHAEISAPMLGVVAALFGLVLAFVIVIAYQNYLSAGDNVNREADDLSAIVRDSALMPEPGGSNVRTAVGAYVSAVVDSEWPAMHDGNTSALALTGLDGIFTAFGTVKPKTATQVAFYNDAVRQLNDALTARRDRIQTAGGGLPEGHHHPHSVQQLRDRRLRRSRRVSELLVSRARAGRDRNGCRGLARGPRRPDLPLLGRRLDLL
jgi:hypothetical protein